MRKSQGRPLARKTSCGKQQHRAVASNGRARLALLATTCVACLPTASPAAARIRPPPCDDPSRRTPQPQSPTPKKKRCHIEASREIRTGNCACCRHNRRGVFASLVAATVADARAPAQELCSKRQLVTFVLGVVPVVALQFLSIPRSS